MRIALISLLFAGVAFAEEPPKKFDVDRLLNAEPGDQIKAALQFNGDVRLAENKLRDARDELKRVRLATTNKVQSLRTERDRARDAIGQADEHLRNEKLPAAQRKTLEQARDKAIALESAKNQELTVALGIAPLMPADAPASPFYMDKKNQTTPLANPREALPKDIVALLDKALAIKLDFEESFEMPLGLGLTELQKKAGSKIVIQTKLQSDQGDAAGQIQFKIPKGEMTLGAALLFIEDQTDLEIHVREYGLVIVQRDHNLTGTPIPLREILKK